MPHEPEELLLSDPDEAFQDAELSEARWQARERQPLLVELSPVEYHLLERLARQQDKTGPQLAQALLRSILSTLSPSMQTSG